MSEGLRRALPWLFLLVALGVSAGFVGITAPDNACEPIGDAFGAGVDTRQSSPLDYVWLHCEVTYRATGETVGHTEVNWYGPVAAIAGCVGAWLLGATLGGTVNRRRGLFGVAAAWLIAAVAVIAFFD